MPGRRREQELLDRPWDRVRPLLPPTRPHPRGGRPFADDEACFAGVVYPPRNAIRWNARPDRFPSGVTRGRRHRDGTAAGVWPRVWPRVWAAVLAEPAAAGRWTRPSCSSTPPSRRPGGGRVSAGPRAGSGSRP